MQYTGFVKAIGSKETFGESFEKQTIVLEENTDREYKGSLAVDFIKDKIQLLDGTNVGDLVTVSLNTRCNESKTQPGKYFNSVSCWRIEKGAGSAPAAQSAKSDDLPF